MPSLRVALLLSLLGGCGSPAPTAPVTPVAPTAQGPGPTTAPTAPTPAPTVTRVSIHSRPAGGGSAQCQFDATGAIHGGHVSGGPSPFVHQDEGRASPEVLASILRAAEATLAAPRPDPGAPETEGTMWIELEQSDGSHARFAWSSGSHHPDARVATLEALLLEHHIGGW